MCTIDMTYTPTHICNIVKWIDLSCHSWLPMKRKLLSALNIHLRKTTTRNELATPYITVQGFINSIFSPRESFIIQMLLHIQLCLSLSLTYLHIPLQLPGTHYFHCIIQILSPKAACLQIDQYMHTDQTDPSWHFCRIWKANYKISIWNEKDLE